FTALAFLLKPYAAFYTVPMIYLVFRRFGFGFFKRWELYMFAVLSLVPLLLWREWISKFPEGVPSYLWLFNGNHIRFHPSFFRWIFYERLTKLILGFGGIILFFIGLVRVRIFKEWIFFLTFILSSLLYVCVVATGNVQHDYYQILIMPSIAIICAVGSYALIKNSRKIANFNVGILVFGISVLIMLGFGWNQVKDYFNINNPGIVAAGIEADKILPKDA